MVTVLKLGGSVITEKATPETIDTATLERAATTIGDAVGDGTVDALVLVHGGGSFGHHHADAHGVTETAGTTDASAVSAIHGAMCDLNDGVVAALLDTGVPAVPIHPLSVARRDEAGNLHLPLRSVSTLVDEGFVPVLHGDVIAHAGRGVTVLSGDEIVVSVARSLDVTRIGLCADVPGVLNSTGDVISELTADTNIAATVGDSSATDVTGGMAAKVQHLLEITPAAEIFGVDGLAAFLRGDSPGTTIR